MRLFMSVTSPFARLTRVVVREKGLQSQVDEVAVDPFADPAALLTANPLGMIPALARDDGDVIIDSRLIAAWLDHLPSKAPALLPQGGPARMAVRTAEAVASGLTDKSVALMMEKRRPEDKRHPPYADRLRAQAVRTAATLPAHLHAQPAPLTLGSIAIVCALGYLDFRHREVDWRAAAPTLAPWYAQMLERPSFAETMPDAA